VVDIRDAFFDRIYDFAKKDRDIVFLTADMGAWSLTNFKRDMPDQFINVGIAEQNMVSIAAGLALTGKKVYVFAIAPFVTQRCYEQIKVDLCVMDLPVTIIGAGPGLSYSGDGPSHYSVEDVAVMNVLPNIAIFNICDEISAQSAAEYSYQCASPVYIRVEKGTHPILYTDHLKLKDGAVLLKSGTDLLMISTGIMSQQTVQLVEQLEGDGVDVAVLSLFCIKPINKDLFLEEIRKVKAVVTIEENKIIGGIGSIVATIMSDNELLKPLKRFGLSDSFSKKYGDREWMHKYYKIDNNRLFVEIKKWISSFL